MKIKLYIKSWIASWYAFNSNNNKKNSSSIVKGQNHRNVYRRVRNFNLIYSIGNCAKQNSCWLWIFLHFMLLPLLLTHIDCCSIYFLLWTYFFLFIIMLLLLLLSFTLLADTCMLIKLNCIFWDLNICWYYVVVVVVVFRHSFTDTHTRYTHDIEFYRVQNNNWNNKEAMNLVSEHNNKIHNKKWYKNKGITWKWIKKKKCSNSSALCKCTWINKRVE